MKKLKLILPLLMLSLIFYTSCSDTEENTIETENYVENAVIDMQSRCSLGRGGCYELVFPVLLEFPDGTTSEIFSFDEGRMAITEWKEANPDAEERPRLQYPYDILNDDGEIITISNDEERAAARENCPRGFKRGKKGFNNACFSIMLPVTIEFPDGSTLEAASRAALKIAVRAWRKRNPNADEKPEVLFPITVELKSDGSQIIVNTKEDIQSLKETCRGEG